jgi:hypothetical protein
LVLKRQDEKLAAYRYRIALFTTTAGLAPDFVETIGSFLADYFDEVAIMRIPGGQTVYLSRNSRPFAGCSS